VDSELAHLFSYLYSVVGGELSSLSGGDDEPVLHDALLLPGDDPSAVSQPTRGECGEHDKLIRTSAALHSSIGSSSLMLLRNRSRSSWVNDGRRLRDLKSKKKTKNNHEYFDVETEIGTKRRWPIIAVPPNTMKSK
jgi:hypothetical protein